MKTKGVTGVLLAVALVALAAANSDPGAGLVGWQNKTCDDPDAPPVIQSYHVHVVWDGANETVNTAALALHSAFADAMASLGIILEDGLCPFSHPNGSPDYELICGFDFNNSRDYYEPWTGVGLFGGSNFAFHVPYEHYMTAMNWFRQRHGIVNYMFHVNTGCENIDHSIYAMKNMEYPDYTQTLTGLWCCHEGPPGCSCDITQYAVADGTKCLRADAAAGTLNVSTCDTSTEWGYATWRETQYLEDLQQLEVYGGDSLGNQFICVGAADGSCEVGTKAALVDCGQVDEVASRLSWVTGSGSLSGTATGNFVSDSCPGLALKVEPDSDDVIFAPSDDADAWTRIFLD